MITKPSPIEPPKAPKSPITCRTIRRAYRVYILNPTPKQLSRIFRGHKRTATDRSITLYIVRGL